MSSSTFPYDDFKNLAVPSPENILDVSETWKVGMGDYSVNKLEMDGIGMSEEGLIFTEVGSLLRDRKVANDNTPVVVVDFGAGKGISMVRLAQKYELEIDAGRLIICATNLFSHPHPNVDRHIYDPWEDATHDDIVESQFGKEYYNYASKVKWIRGDANAIASFLEKNNYKIDILHEKFAFIHIKNIEKKNEVAGSDSPKFNQVIKILKTCFNKKYVAITSENYFDSNKVIGLFTRKGVVNQLTHENSKIPAAYLFRKY